MKSMIRPREDFFKCYAVSPANLIIWLDQHHPASEWNSQYWNDLAYREGVPDRMQQDTPANQPALATGPEGARRTFNGSSQMMSQEVVASWTGQRVAFSGNGRAQITWFGDEVDLSPYAGITGVHNPYEIYIEDASNLQLFGFIAEAGKGEEEGRELITNSDMALDDASWSTVNTPTVQERSTEQAHSSIYSRKITCDAQWEGIQSIEFPVTLNQTYRLKFWVYAVDNPQIQITIKAGNGAASIATPIFDSPLGVWTQIVYDYTETVGGAGAVVRIISPTDATSGTWYIDDVSEKEYPSSNLVTNGDMELDANWGDVGTPTTNERSGEQAHSGSFSRKFTADAQYEGIISDAFTTTNGRTYKISAWVYGDGVNAILLDSGAGAVFARDRVAYPGAGYIPPAAWTKHEWYFTARTTGTTYQVRVISDTGITSGTHYVDDVRVVEIDEYNKQSVHIVDAPLSSTKNFAYANASFDYNDDAGFTIQVRRTSFQSLSSISAAAWVKPDDGHPTETKTIITKWYATNHQRLFILYLDATGKINFAVSQDGTNNASKLGIYTTDDPQFSDGVQSNFTHVCGVYDTSIPGCAVYINGSPVAITRTSGSGDISSLFASSYAPCDIGMYENNALYWDGAIASVMLFGRALSAAEMGLLYNADKARFLLG